MNKIRSVIHFIDAAICEFSCTQCVSSFPSDVRVKILWTFRCVLYRHTSDVGVVPSHKAIRFWPSGTKIYRPFDSLEGCNPGTKRANALGMPGGGIFAACMPLVSRCNN